MKLLFLLAQSYAIRIMCGLVFGLIFSANASLAMTNYEKEISDWRTEQEQKLRGEEGWLTVVGLHWLKDGVNEVGSRFGAHVPLPKRLPKDFAVIRKGNGKQTIEFKYIKNTKLDSNSVELKKEYALETDKSENMSKIFVDGAQFFLIGRPNGIGVRIKDPQSEARKNFKGRKWYAVSEGMRIEADWLAFPTAKKIIVPDILGNMNEEKSPGEASFKIDGQLVKLMPTQDDDKLFFVFRDGTSGKETYGSARFLYTDLPKDKKLILDFNKSVNPPCAFTDFATCPTAPTENRLEVRIPAGEMYRAPF
jgi:uncharacterized protein (DUF1684 family)